MGFRGAFLGRPLAEYFVFVMGKANANDKVMAKVLAETERVVSAPMFKRGKMLLVRDFPPGCGRVNASNFGLCRQITVDQSSHGKW
ncbi:hypothetical protein J1N35_018895 [Gossypium stocksii]|uniref:Uncharacterized protein n=1 Tax=Gossypium stocksii TaxID=47602 RepID=A0A9D3VS23_9ROSI|nr:hypothetical protein J1N35_018895 [Gossypium stocksii]